jgi:hypothetical protein
LNRVLIYIGRFAAMSGGFIAASLAASAMITLLFIGPLGWTADELPYVMTGSVIVAVPFLAAFVGYFAFVPALPVMVAGELLGRRGWLFHTLGGGLVAVVVLAAIWGDAWRGSGEDAVPLAAIIVAAGLAGGFAYWLVAGRNAGLWIEEAAASD